MLALACLVRARRARPGVGRGWTGPPAFSLDAVAW